MTQKETLNSIFNDRIFNIPGYQRGYSWESSQLKDFFKDLGWITPGKKHFTGTLAMCASYQDRRILDVIDGQQRLTTSFLLINALIKKAEKYGQYFIGDGEVLFERRKYLYSIDADRNEFLRLKYHSDENNKFLKTVIESNVSALENLKPSNVYGRNLRDAALFFENEIKSFSSNELNRYFKLLTNEMTFQFEQVQSEFDVCSMFESINYRGKKLSKFEVLKNRLIYLIDLISKKSSVDEGDEINVTSAINKIQEAWSAAYNQFGLGEEVLDEDEFLLIHTEMYFGPLKKKKDALDDRLFKDIFSLENIRRPDLSDLDRDNCFCLINKYVDNIRQSACLWALQRAKVSKFDIPVWLGIESYKWLLKINRLPKSPFDSLILAILNSAESGNEEFDLTEVLCKVERFIFLIYGLCNYSSKQSEGEILEMAYNIYNETNEISISDIHDIFEKMIFGVGEDDEEGLFKLSTILNNVHVRFTNEKNGRNMGWRRWDGISYFLMEYEIFLRKNKEFVWDDEYKTCEIEHIFPVSMIDDFKNSSFKDSIANKRKIKCYLNDLGNLVILERKINNRAKDKLFNEKKSIYMGSNFESVRQLLSENDWNVLSVEKRGIELLKFMKERWDIPVEEDNEFKFNMWLAETFKPQRGIVRKR